MQTRTETEAAAAVRALRARHQESVDDVAALIGKSRTTTSLKINGHKPFTLEQLEVIADHYGMRVADLFAYGVPHAVA